MRLMLLYFLCAPLLCEGRDWYVNNQTGTNDGDGSKEQPFRIAQVAVNRAKSGDQVHLFPKGAVYRQQISIRGKTNIVILGNGVTLTGADPLSETGWENLENGLKRRRMKKTLYDRHLLIREGKANRMGRSPSIKKAFPSPEELKTGEFSWQHLRIENHH